MKNRLYKKPSHASHKLSGFSLVEALVGMTVGLLLLAGVLKVFQGSQQAQQLQKAMEEIQETSRFVLGFVNQDLRMAGYPRGSTTIATAIIGSNNSGVNGSDTITIQYESSRNCGGEDTGSNLTQNQYAIATTSSGAFELRCTANIVTGTKEYSIAEGVENIQILYGEDTDSIQDGVVNVYRSADHVIDWSRVITLRLAFLLVTSGYVNAPTDKTFRMLNEPTIGPFADGHLRRIYLTTTLLRNQRQL